MAARTLLTERREEIRNEALEAAKKAKTGRKGLGKHAADFSDRKRLLYTPFSSPTGTLASFTSILFHAHRFTLFAHFHPFLARLPRILSPLARLPISIPFGTLASYPSSFGMLTRIPAFSPSLPRHACPYLRFIQLYSHIPLLLYLRPIIRFWHSFLSGR
jgi:hypothetical protein